MDVRYEKDISSSTVHWLYQGQWRLSFLEMASFPREIRRTSASKAPERLVDMI
jgi:hypothetical protein